MSLWSKASMSSTTSWGASSMATRSSSVRGRFIDHPERCFGPPFTAAFKWPQVHAILSSSRSLSLVGASATF